MIRQLQKTGIILLKTAVAVSVLFTVTGTLAFKSDYFSWKPDNPTGGYSFNNTLIDLGGSLLNTNLGPVRTWGDASDWYDLNSNGAMQLDYGRNYNFSSSGNW